MPPRSLVPKHISYSLTYEPEIPSFLESLKKKATEQQKATPKFEDYIDGQDDEDYDELEGAQIVELDKNGREIHKDAGTQSDKDDDDDDGSKEEKEEKEEDRPPPVDETGRIMFRPTAKSNSSSSKRKLQSIIDEEIEKSSSSSKKGNKDEKEQFARKKKKNKKKTANSLLSFNEED